MTHARWLEIASDLRSRVISGEWPPGGQLPPTRQLMTEYNVTSPNVVARAIATLRAEGLLIADPQAPRRGVQVRAQHFFQRELDAYRREFREALAGQTRTFETLTGMKDASVDVAISYETMKPPKEIAEVLGTRKNVLYRTFTYRADGTPHQVARSYMTADLADRIGLNEPESEQPGRTTMAWLLDAGVQVTRASTSLRARVPTPEESAQLSITPGVPIFVHGHTLFAGDQAVETGGGFVAADQVEYVMHADLTKEA
jgi:GntR family transcriptional regulator